jgi:hypothetical protein
MRDRPGRRAPGCGTRLRSGARRRPSLSRSRGCRDVSRRRRPQHAQPAAVITARAFVPPFRCAPARFVRRLPRLHAPLSHELGGVIAVQEAARHRPLTFCATLNSRLSARKYQENMGTGATHVQPLHRPPPARPRPTGGTREDGPRGGARRRGVAGARRGAMASMRGSGGAGAAAGRARARGSHAAPPAPHARPPEAGAAKGAVPGAARAAGTAQGALCAPVEP